MEFVEHSREELRPVVDQPEAFDDALEALAAGSGDVAFDTERAHGHRYWPKAYLLQIRREGAGTWLIDPVALEGTRSSLSSLVDATGSATWIIHAASQDLPCMQEVGIIPPEVFDTEMAARLLGKPSASLGSLLHSELGINLRKAHSADNWSKRPLPESWLTYAALDVDYLLELAVVLREELVKAGRAEWSREEDIETLSRYSTPPTPRVDPWRRLSGVTTLRTPLQFGIARELWFARDALARKRDRPPTWMLPDATILSTASWSRDRVPQSSDLLEIHGYRSGSGQRHLKIWAEALDRVRALDPKELPPKRAPLRGLPQPRAWDKINPEAAARWALVRPAVDSLACELGGLQPSIVAPPAALQEAIYHHDRVSRETLLTLGVRPWQADFLVPVIEEALA